MCARNAGKNSLISSYLSNETFRYLSLSLSLSSNYSIFDFDF